MAVAAYNVHGFEEEAEAQKFVAERLEPFCSVLEQEPVFSNGLRPDIGFRLKSLPDIPMTVEIKAFGSGVGGQMAAAIAQAASYSELTNTPSFVAALKANGPSHLAWHSCPLGAMLLAGGQFNVGGLYFTTGKDKTKIGGLVLSGVQVAMFSFDGYGSPHTTLHPKAEHLLKRKHRAGSSSWR